MPTADEKETIEDVREAGLLCPRCEASNVSERRFCAKCGAALWEDCFRCGEVCAAGESYCGACGANLADAAAEQLERVQDDFRAAAEMRSAGRFGDAIDLLTPIAENRHARLTRYAAHADQLIRQLTAERDQRRTVSDEAFQRAGERFAAFDYDQAASILQQVPPTCRSQDIEELSTKVGQCREELAALDRELRAAVQQKRLFDLPPKLERILELKPDHAYAKAVGEQLWTRVGEAAEKRMTDYRHQEALELLDRVPPKCRGPRLEELRRRAAELALLNFDLRNAPMLDATLVAAAKQLRLLTPGDAQAAKVCEELQRRAAQAEAQGERGPICWAPAPQETPLDVAMEALAALPRIILAPAAASDPELLRSPGRFAVACGLGLAGLKRAAVRVNLLNGEKQNVVSQASRLLRSYGDRPAWGLDLGMSGLKAVRLVWNAAAQQVIVEAACVVEHAKPLGEALNEAEEQKLIAQTLSTFLERHRPKAERVAVGLPSRIALIRQFELPPVEQAKVPKLVEFEARQQFPFPLEQLTWDYQFLDEAGPDAGTPRSRPGKRWRKLLLLGAQALSARRYLDGFRRQSIPVDVLQTDSIALHNFLVHEYCPASANGPPGGGSSAVAVLDVGCNVTNIVVSTPHTLWFRSCGVAGHSFTRALVKEFNLTVAQAEQCKRSPESAASFHEIDRAFAPLFDDLLKEVRQSLAAFAQAMPDCPVQRIIGVGGGFSLHGLFRYLRCGR